MGADQALERFFLKSGSRSQAVIQRLAATLHRSTASDARIASQEAARKKTGRDRAHGHGQGYKGRQDGSDTRCGTVWPQSPSEFEAFPHSSLIRQPSLRAKTNWLRGERRCL
jgi:hypothetical protein